MRGTGWYWRRNLLGSPWDTGSGALGMGSCSRVLKPGGGVISGNQEGVLWYTDVAVNKTNRCNHCFLIVLVFGRWWIFVSGYFPLPALTSLPPSPPPVPHFDFISPSSCSPPPPCQALVSIPLLLLTEPLRGRH